MTIEEFFELMGLTFNGRRVTAESLTVSCPSCREDRSLGGIGTMSNSEETVYPCPGCGNPLAKVTRHSIDFAGSHRIEL